MILAAGFPDKVSGILVQNRPNLQIAFAQMPDALIN
jgi:hypothetical protein